MYSGSNMRDAVCRAVHPRHGVGGGAPFNFGRRRRAAGQKKSAAAMSGGVGVKNNFRQIFLLHAYPRPSDGSLSYFINISDSPYARPKRCIIATSIVHAKLHLDYYKSLFLNIDSTQISRIQAVQDAIVRAVTKTPRHHNITHVLKTLRWLRIPDSNRIQSNITHLQGY